MVLPGAGPAWSTKRVQTAYDLVEKLYGVKLKTHRNRTVSSIGTTVGVVAINDPTRVILLITNLGSSAVYLLPEEAPTAAKHIRLDPTGGFVALNAIEDFTLPALEWQALGAAAGLALLVLEGCIIGEV